MVNRIRRFYNGLYFDAYETIGIRCSMYIVHIDVELDLVECSFWESMPGGKKVTQKSFLFYHDLRSVRIDTVLHCCQWQWLRSLCVWLCLGSDRSAGRGEHRMPWHTGTHAPFSFNQHKFTIRRTMDPRCLRLLDSSQNFVFYHFSVSG